MTKLPPGRHGLARAFVVHNQRDRVLTAIAEEVSANGYAEVTVADVIARAGVSRRTFYELFRDKDDCFLAAYDAAVELLNERLPAVLEAEPEPTLMRVRALMVSVLELFAAEPDFARMCLVEVGRAGPEAVRRYYEAFDAFVPLIENLLTYDEARKHRGSNPPPDRLTIQALVGGIVSVITRRIVAGDIESLPELVPSLTSFLLVPIVGEQEARAVAAGRGAARRKGTPRPNAAGHRPVPAVGRSLPAIEP
jgi:AcrR family transcriptional regulator